MQKVSRSYLRKLRHVVQWTVLFLAVHAGVTFYHFVSAVEQNAVPTVSRPPSVEGFLPIGGLMGLKLWLITGIFDTIHPASIVIFCGALIISLLLRKSFCSWICPVGTFSEVLWKIGYRILGRNYVFPKYVDYPLRSVKYIVMSFFLYIILVQMSPSEIAGFLETPYWKVIDMKMLSFFTEMSVITAIVLGVLAALSLPFKNFWCRYLCPYGALLGLLGCASPLAITRDEKSCIHCNLCTRSCPSLLKVDEKTDIISPECSGCLTCVSHCPSKGALETTLAFSGKMHLHAAIPGISVAAVFFGLILIARLSGRWNSALSYAEFSSILNSIGVLIHP